MIFVFYKLDSEEFHLYKRAINVAFKAKNKYTKENWSR